MYVAYADMRNKIEVTYGITHVTKCTMDITAHGILVKLCEDIKDNFKQLHDKQYSILGKNIVRYIGDDTVFLCIHSGNIEIFSGDIKEIEILESYNQCTQQKDKIIKDIVDGFYYREQYEEFVNFTDDERIFFNNIINDDQYTIVGKFKIHLL